MNFRATNRPEDGYQFAGSFRDEAEAQAWGLFEQYDHVWALEFEGDAPEWTEYPVQD